MLSELKSEAALINGMKSPHPKTSGKQEASSRNPLKHRLYDTQDFYPPERNFRGIPEIPRRISPNSSPARMGANQNPSVSAGDTDPENQNMAKQTHWSRPYLRLSFAFSPKPAIPIERTEPIFSR
jgi:hypothetical protein